MNKSASVRNVIEFEILCRSFTTPPLKLSANILNYWYTRRNSYPELYWVAEFVFGVPGIQVSVERLFTMLKFILDPLRSRLTSDNNINAILMLKVNLPTFNRLTLSNPES